MSKLVELFNNSSASKYLASCSEKLIQDYGLKGKSLGYRDVKFKNEDEHMEAHQMHLYEKIEDSETGTNVVDDSTPENAWNIEHINNEIERLKNEIVGSADRLGPRRTATCTTDDASIAGNKRMAANDVEITGLLGDDVVKRFRFAAQQGPFKREDWSKLGENEVMNFFHNLGIRDVSVLFSNDNKRKQHSLLEYSGEDDSNKAKSAGACCCIPQIVFYIYLMYFFVNLILIPFTVKRS